MNKFQTHDILAKLLATENVTVIRENVSTASFDIKNRVLRLPRWKDLTPEVEEMLILHEVGHALYTTPEVYGQLYEDNRDYLREYANVIEDVRIEKKMKDRYPGSRKTFNVGYTELNEKDFFGVKGKDLNNVLLIDKINIYYKVGYNAGVPFSAEEYVFVQKADKCVTEEDVIDLAEEIFAYSKAEKKKKQKEEAGNQSSDEFGDAEDGDFDGDISGKTNDIEDDESLAPQTMSNFDDKLEDLQDRESRTYYYDAKFQVETESPIVGYKKVFEELASRFNYDQPLAKAKANEFKASSISIVNYLVKEFEMRKSASAYKRTKISRIGQLDTRKLFAYTLKDDIFKQIATVQEGKKHGMIFLLDWSGSMNRYIHETLEQVINLAMFCRKINIPFQVFAFSDGYDHKRECISTKNVNGLGNMQSFSLLEFFNHKMNTRDFNAMIEQLLNRPWNHHNYSLNGTPLNDSLLYMTDYIGKFMKENQAEKMTFITLTDGESNRLSQNGCSHGVYGINNGSTTITEHGSRVRVNAKSIIQDHMTRKEYGITELPSQQTSVLLNIIRDRYGINSVGFHILSATLDDVRRFVKNNMAQLSRSADVYSEALNLQSKLRREKSLVIKNIPGRDELYLLASTNKIEDDDIEDVTQDMSASQISKHLTKMFTSRKSSRVVLSSFIGMAA